VPVRFAAPALALLLVAVGALALDGPRRWQAAQEARQEAQVLQRIHRGQTRAEFYAMAKAVGVAPWNPEYVRLAPSGPPIDNGKFPEPNAAHRHPSVQIFFSGYGWFLWRQDEIEVLFDKSDHVARWKVTVSTSGA
jgi:hypothetical protein